MKKAACYVMNVARNVTFYPVWSMVIVSGWSISWSLSNSCSYQGKISSKTHKTVPIMYTSLPPLSLLILKIFDFLSSIHAKRICSVTHTLQGTETIWIWYSYLPIHLVLIFLVTVTPFVINFKQSAVTCPTAWTITFSFTCSVLLFPGKKILNINNSLEVN